MNLEYAPVYLGSSFICNGNGFSVDSVAPAYIKKYKHIDGLNKEQLNAMIAKQTARTFNDAFEFIKNMQRIARINKKEK